MDELNLKLSAQEVNSKEFSGKNFESEKESFEIDDAFEK